MFKNKAADWWLAILTLACNLMKKSTRQHAEILTERAGRELKGLDDG
jgi:hypothetical protein